jgi:hypothetical protein
MVARPDDRAAIARVFPTGLTILRVLGVARWLAWGWMFAVVAFSGDALRHPVVAWMTVAAGLALSVVSTWWLRSGPDRLLDAPFVASEAVLALAFSVLDGWVFEPGHVFGTSQNLATQWPLIAAVSIGVAAGPIAAAAYGALVGPARWVAAELNDFGEYDPKHLVSLAAASLFYAASGAVFGWLARLLRRAEGEIADRRARDEVARVLHDTVLQTLAMVERRAAPTDPELAAMARQADLDLRAFLFDGPAAPRHGDGRGDRGRVRGAPTRRARLVGVAHGWRHRPDRPGRRGRAGGQLRQRRHGRLGPASRHLALTVDLAWQVSQRSTLTGIDPPFTVSV